MKYFPVAATAIVTAAALAAASWAGTPTLTVVVVVLCGIVALGWPQLMGVNARRSLSAVIFVAGVLAALGSAVVERAESLFFWSSVALAFGVMSVFVIQVVRGTGQPQRLESTIGACGGVVITTTAAGWVSGLRYPAELVSVHQADGRGLLAVRGLLHYEDSAILAVTGTGGELSVVGLAAMTLVASALAACIPARDAVVLPLVLLGGAGTGLGAGMLWGELTLLFVGILGLGAGMLMASFRRFLILRGPPQGAFSACAVGAAPIAAMGAVVYFTERLLFV